MNGLGSRAVRLAIVAVLLVGTIAPAATAQEDQTALLARLKELVEARGTTRYVTRAENSRSAILSVDVSTSMFFFIERGSIRGTAIDDFDAAMAAGDMDAAHRTFIGNAIMTLRATDYGWNGLGIPLVTDSGAEVNDMVFKDINGVFARAPEVSADDVANFVSLVQYVISQLEQS